MSFKYSVIGDNTPENLNHLELIGVAFIGISPNDKILRVTNGSAITMSAKDYEVFQKCSFSNEHTNCINNPQLFRAVTAMRDDSDMWQYFTNGVKLILFDGDDFNEFYIKMNYYRKATLEELINHFKL